MNDFRLIMISAGFEHGGNVMHRHLDGHPRLLVYPFESQLGNRNFSDFLASVERVQYRYPEFPEGITAAELYEQPIDEELKTFLRKKEASKFRGVNLDMDETDRINAFVRLLAEPPYSRRRVIEAFFRSTFIAWKNYYVRPAESMAHVGYSPAIGLDCERMILDFPNIRILHIIRNPFSAYRDTKRRPFPQSLSRYLISWNIYHSTVEMYSRMYPQNVKICRFEDLVDDKPAFMQKVAAFIGAEFDASMLYPSWNGIEIKENIAPWGTVLKCTKEYNREIIDELDQAEKTQIRFASAALARHFGYCDVPYLEALYA